MVFTRVVVVHLMLEKQQPMEACVDSCLKGPKKRFLKAISQHFTSVF